MKGHLGASITARRPAVYEERGAECGEVNADPGNEDAEEVMYDSDGFISSGDDFETRGAFASVTINKRKLRTEMKQDP